MEINYRRNTLPVFFFQRGSAPGMEMLSGSTTNLFLFWNESKHKFADDLRGLAKTKFNIVDFPKRT
jgi:hypothetical protein